MSSITDFKQNKDTRKEEEQLRADQEQQEDWTPCCPICFLEHVPLLQARSCGHAFCMDCLQQLFALSPPTQNTDGVPQKDPQKDNDTDGMRQNEEEDPQNIESMESSTTSESALSSSSLLLFPVHDLRNHSIDNIATLERCPLCRNPMSLLDLTETIKTPLSSSDDGGDKHSKQAKQAQQQQPWWLENDQVFRDKRLFKTPLAGKTYATRQGIGWNSFHFPENAIATDTYEDDNKNSQGQRPYFLWQEDDAFYPPPSNNNNTDSNDNNNKEPTKYYFEPGYFYFAPKRIFHGRLLLPDAHGNMQPHDVLISFAANFKWITGGFMLQSLYDPTAAATKEKQQLEEEEKENNDDNSVGADHYYPLEGSWKVTWYRQKLPPDAVLYDNISNTQYNDLMVATDLIEVVGNALPENDASPFRYMLRYENNNIYFHWPTMGVTQTLEPECDFRETKRIPAVGEYLKWTTTDQDQPYIVWQRQTMGACPPTAKTCISYFGRSGGGGDSALNGGSSTDPFHARTDNPPPSWYRLWQPSEVAAADLLSRSAAFDNNRDARGRPRYHAHQLWGNTFCQGLRVGLASYHFGWLNDTNNTENNHNNNTDAEESGQPYAYISYENSMCSSWPPLDDGSPIPPRVPFHDISFEEVEVTRPIGNTDQDDNDENHDNDGTNNTVTMKNVIFRGNIEWQQDYGTTWQNSERWEYEMHFDSRFTCILSGTVHSINANHAPDHLTVPFANTSRRQEMSQYGTDLVYINAGILQAFDRWMMDPSSSTNYGPQDVSANDNNDEFDDGSYQRYRSLSRSIRRRLQAEGASVRTVAILNMVLTMSQQPAVTDIIDYNQ